MTTITRRQRRSAPWLRLVSLVVLTSCLKVDSTTKVTTFDAPDPAAVFVPLPAPYYGFFQVYTTQSGLCGFYAATHVPTFSWAPGGSLVGCADALPTLPPHATAARIWAPTVRFVAGRYLLFYSGSADNHAANCLFAATSSNPAGPFAPASIEWCDPAGGTGWLDPQLFVDTDGTPYLLYSVQWAANGGSRIVTQRLTANGLGRSGSPVSLLEYATVASEGGGGSSFVENPAMAWDTSTYDLLVSIGTWSNSTYKTLQIPCSSATSCSTTVTTLIASGNGLDGPGGMSLAYDSAAGNYGFFAARDGSGSTRFTYGASMSLIQ